MAELEDHPRTVSVVLPVHNQADHIGGVVENYLGISRRLPLEVELVLVANACSDDSLAVCHALAASHPEVLVIEQSLGGWGRAVRAGLASAHGELLGYANSARTSPEILALMLSYAHAYPHVVLKANRKIRDSIFRRAGSLLYNLECRALFNMPTWDVNGTPKLFPRSFHELLKLHSSDDLIDAEFVLACQRASYPIIEVPLLATTRLGGRSTTNFRSAARMYRGAVGLRLREMRR
ncbi:MAG TPA: glycosyltransferase [Solirubrobacteraceae bacterium]|nr:glycosyltransferase [Solirubrobacteraceae bacterium]